MKKAALFVMAIMVMSSSVPAFAMEKMEKDECLTMSMNCKTEVDDIQKKVKKLNAEIKKGSKVYTPEELKALNNKLKEVNAMIDSLNRPGK
ncbi:MAG: hypothetical protein FPO08_00550 [Geobacter sp.]|nr:MAG: hypothetical protein FPO08_00550 [Geobacter sp.]